MKLKYKYFAIDFDGTIAYDAYPNIGRLIPGAKETMLKIKELGGEIVIWTCRTDQWATDAVNFLNMHNIPYDKFNKPFDEHVNIYGGDNSRKIYADCYIDDRSLHFQQQPVDWNDVQSFIFEYEEWKVGDTIECTVNRAMNSFNLGEQFQIRQLMNDIIAFGPVMTELKIAQKYFKKVN